MKVFTFIFTFSLSLSLIVFLADMEFSTVDFVSDDASHFGGLWPPMFNIAPKAILYVNATCGQESREEFCHINDAHPQSKNRRTKCAVCDGKNDNRSHPIENVVDGSSKWWQSPTLASDAGNEYVTITMDLKQVSHAMGVATPL